jgi:MFS family permease
MLSPVKMDGPPSFRALLRDRNFFRLWVGQIVSSVGDRLYQMALLQIVLDQAESGKETARITFLALLPGFLCAPFFGWIVDRFERRMVMAATDVVRAALAVMLIFGFGELGQVVVLAVVFAMGAMNGLFIPARQASVPQLVAPGSLVTANALISMVGIMASLLSGVLGVIILGIFPLRDGPAILLATVAAFIVSAWAVLTIGRPLSPLVEGEREPDVTNRLFSFIDQLTVGFRVVWRRSDLMALILLKSLFAFTAGVFLVVGLEHAAKNLDLSLAKSWADGIVAFLTPWCRFFHLKPPVFTDVKLLAAGTMFGALGLGLGLGVVFCGKSRLAHWNGLPFFGLLLLGLGILAYARLDHIGAAMLLMLPLGLFAAVINIPADARLQHETTDSHRGRVFAFANLATTVAMLAALGLNLDGSLLRAYGAAHLVTALGASVAALAIFLALLNFRQLSTFWETWASQKR